MFTVHTGVQLGKTGTQVDTGVRADVFIVRVVYGGHRSQSGQFLEKL